MLEDSELYSDSECNIGEVETILEEEYGIDIFELYCGVKERISELFKYKYIYSVYDEMLHEDSVSIYYGNTKNDIVNAVRSDVVIDDWKTVTIREVRENIELTK